MVHVGIWELRLLPANFCFRVDGSPADRQHSFAAGRDQPEMG